MDKSLTSSNRNLLNQSLKLQVQQKQKHNCAIYGAINAVFLAVVWFDISQKCPYTTSYLYYFEYAAAFILGLSLLYYVLSWMYYRFFVTPLVVTEEQRKLLRLDEHDGTFVVSPTKTLDPNITLDQTNTPANISSLSWQSYTEGNHPSASWAYNKGSQSFDSPSFNLMNISTDVSFNQSSQVNASSVSLRNYNNQSEMITDAKRIKQYLKETNEAEAKNANVLQASDCSYNQNNESFTSFWNNCHFDNLSSLLKTSLYQLSPTSAATSPSGSKQNVKDDHTNALGKSLGGNSEILKKIPSEKLSAYVANLRIWISDTILQRLVKEFDFINDKLMSRGFSDIQIGAVGFERLKKTAENYQLVSSHVPTLPMIIPFLEMSTNQEYLVKRIRDLAHGKCISDYRWNSGIAYGSTAWNDHMPTDSAILFHLICTYFDSQLMPLPNRSRPFYSQYVVEIDGNKKSQSEILSEVKNKTKCAILCMNPMKPKFNFISDEMIHTCPHDRLNLFNVIIQFLLFMKSHNDSLLEGVSLGKRGINIMCCVEEATV